MQKARNAGKESKNTKSVSSKKPGVAKKLNKLGEVDGDKELTDKVAEATTNDDQEPTAAEGSEKVIDPDLLVAEDDVVTGFGVEEEGVSAAEESEDEEDGVSEESYDPFGDRFEQ